MNKMKCMALLAAFSASVCMAQTKADSSQAPAPQVLNAVVAVVNNDVITTGELAERAHSAALNLRRQKIQLPPMPQLRAQVLEQLILERAIAQRARETGIRVDDGVVNATIEQIAQQNKISVAELRRRLSLDGVTFPQFREEIRSQIITQRLREREVDEEIKIPESEIDAFLADQAGYNINDTIEYDVSHIWIPTSEGMSSEELRAAHNTAEDILERAQDGEDFGQLAASYSKASDALEGGNLGWRTLSQMPTALASAVRDARQESSRIAMNVSSDGYYIVKVNGRRDGVKTKLAGGPVTQTHARHILMAVTPVTDEATVLNRLNDIRNRLVNNKEDFATLARLHSVDGSATRGGDLGWLHPGDTVPAFEAAMNKLQPGEVSQPIKTQYGYHLIQVVDRREEAMDAERMRFMARQILRQRKLAEATATWQRELRDRAYVEIRRDEL
ncbi:peptidylprolyl isomerase [Parasutterella secunda]|uniref:Chaperone SurA n=1 Tax=Parasutterella secunda TaxID=626947 RepID=A0ABS2GQM4_9BURK|nr:peptidylprolyl isomerase [Parasutterella secunda]MBM6928075.1 peptidylprolyl isomerase [Parasutterella secunda]